MRNLPFGPVVTIVRQTESGQKDKYNKIIPGTPEQITVQANAYWPIDSNGAGGNEFNQSVDQVPAGAYLVFPDGTDIRDTDAVLIDGVLWQVYGSLMPFGSPFTGTGGGIRAQLLRHEG